MKRKLMLALLVSLLATLLLISGAFAAKLLCVSHQDIKGEMTVDKCLDKGMEFAVMDANGIVRILSKREVELTRKLNPKALETKAFGITHYRLAPDLPPLPVPPEAQ